jgi:protein-S-isoprenylcysteine O-methyltransferase Ste14
MKTTRFVQAARVEKAKVTDPLATRIAYLMVAVFAASLLVFRTQLKVLGVRLWPQNELTFSAGAVLLFLGLGFAVWARTHLGQFWSGTVSLRALIPLPRGVKRRS